MALFNLTDSYKILAISRYDQLGQDATEYAVAYRSQMHGEAWYKIRYANNYLLDNDPKKLLIESAYAQGGSDMAIAMEAYIKWTGAGWDNLNFTVSTNYDHYDFHSSPVYKPATQTITIDNNTQYEEMKSIYFGKEHVYKNYSYPSVDWKNIGYTAEGAPLHKSAPASSGADAAVNSLPGLTAMVSHPAIKANDPGCAWQKFDDTSLKNMIIHLNDSHKWTREEVADWLETLDVDLRFKSPEDRLKEAKQGQLEELTSKLTNAQTSLKLTMASLKSTKAKIAEFTEQITKLQEEINVQD